MNMLRTVTAIAICISAVTCQMNPGLMQSMGMGMAMGGELSAEDYMILDNAVKHVVGPKATPSPSIVLLAQQQGGAPSSFTNMMPYITLMQNMAHTTGLKPPGTIGKPTRSQVNNHVMQRAMNWIQQRNTFEAMAESPVLAATLMGRRGVGNMMGQRGANTAKVAPKTATNGKPANKQAQAHDLLSMMAMSRAMGMEGMMF